MTLLATRSRWPFQELKNALQMSDGNLVTHLRTLHKPGTLLSPKKYWTGR